MEPLQDIFPGAINMPTLNAHATLTAALAERFRLDEDNGVRAARALELGAGSDLQALDVIAGVGLGLVEHADEIGPGLVEGTGDIGLGTACLEIYTTEPLNRQDIANLLATTLGMTTLDFDEVSMRILNTGPIGLQSHSSRQRPAPGGISIGHSTLTERRTPP